MSTAARKLRQRAIKTNLLVRCEAAVSVYGGVGTWPIFTTFSCHSDFISHFIVGFPGLGQYLCAPVTRSGQRLYSVYCPIAITRIVTAQPSFICIYTSETPNFCPLFTHLIVCNSQSSSQTPASPICSFVVLHESDEKNVCGRKIALEL